MYFTRAPRGMLRRHVHACEGGHRAFKVNCRALRKLRPLRRSTFPASVIVRAIFEQAQASVRSCVEANAVERWAEKPLRKAGGRPLPPPHNVGGLLWAAVIEISPAELCSGASVQLVVISISTCFNSSRSAVSLNCGGVEALFKQAKRQERSIYSFLERIRRCAARFQH